MKPLTIKQAIHSIDDMYYRQQLVLTSLIDSLGGIDTLPSKLQKVVLPYLTISDTNKVIPTLGIASTILAVKSYENNKEALTDFYALKESRRA